MNQEHKRKNPQNHLPGPFTEKENHQKQTRNLNKSEEHCCSPLRRRLTSNLPLPTGRKDGEAAPRDGGSGRGQLLGSPFYRGGNLSQHMYCFLGPFLCGGRDLVPLAGVGRPWQWAVGEAIWWTLGSRAKIWWWTELTEEES
jgi:hypothetical protein